MTEHLPTPEAIKSYYNQKFQSVKSGNIEFVRRNFEAELGAVEDLYGYLGKIGSQGGRPVHYGYIQNDYGYGADAYLNIDKKFEKINESPVRVEEARELLFRRVVN